jgi:hypothetical protein
MLRKVVWATLVTLGTLLVQGSTQALQQSEGSEVNYVKIEICGDVAGKDPSSGCIKIEKYLWGKVGDARLIPSQRRGTGGKYEPYNLVIESRGCFPTYQNAEQEGTYDLNTRISVMRNGRTTIKTSAHPVVQEIVEQIGKNRNTPELIGGRSCQRVTG